MDRRTGQKERDSEKARPSREEGDQTGPVGEGEAGFLLSREPQAGLGPKTRASGPPQRADAAQGSHPAAPIHDSISLALFNPLDSATLLGSAFSVLTLTHCVLSSALLWSLRMLGIFSCVSWLMVFSLESFCSRIFIVWK